MNLVKSIDLINEAFIAITYTQHEDFPEVMGNASTIIAAY
uniref:Uncharacterized protein n=1 Tax=Romanomermis culicivorax TaxID=13658 RepID=A0A915HY42_ROMCU